MAAKNTFIWSTAPNLFKTPADLQWKLDADKLIELKGQIANLESEAKTLGQNLLDEPKAQEYINLTLKKKISFFIGNVETKIDVEKAAALLTKAELLKVISISAKALTENLPEKASKIILKASYTTPKADFVKVGDVAKDDTARVQAAINSGSLGFDVGVIPKSADDKNVRGGLISAVREFHTKRYIATVEPHGNGAKCLLCGHTFPGEAADNGLCPGCGTPIIFENQ